MVHLLIDYESLQPNPLEDWVDKEARVTVFVGAHQHRIPFELASAMQALGKRGRYVKVKHTGKNALDFQLMFHLGELVGQDPGATYRIVSKDTGFDALIEDLRARGLAVERLSLEPAKSQAERRSLADAGNAAASEKPPSRRRVPGQLQQAVKARAPGEDRAWSRPLTRSWMSVTKRARPRRVSDLTRPSLRARYATALLPVHGRWHVAGTRKRFSRVGCFERCPFRSWQRGPHSRIAQLPWPPTFSRLDSTRPPCTMTRMPEEERDQLLADPTWPSISGSTPAQSRVIVEPTQGQGQFGRH